MATEKYILISISAGVMEEAGKAPMPYASVEVANAKGKDQSTADRVSYGSPVLKCKLVQESNGLPNIALAKRLAAANLYGQVVTFEGAFELQKLKGAAQMTFTIFDADFEAL